MRKFKSTNPCYCDPPGAFREILSHPVLPESKAIEQATFKEHRFAFFYWYKWYKDLTKLSHSVKPPTLITIDYHRDLAVPSDREKTELLEVERFSDSELAIFCWARMNTQNDGHILSAAFLNIIGDIILLKQQDRSVDKEDLTFIDNYNNKHNIYEFDNIDKFESFILSYETENIFLDIDLDYFISHPGHYMHSEGYITMNDDEISNIINPSRPYLKKIYNFLEGITIATEPKHCGGIINSCKILFSIENQLFSDGKKWK